MCDIYIDSTFVTKVVLAQLLYRMVFLANHCVFLKSVW